MKPNTDNNTPYYNRSGIYKLTCNTWKLEYVGQTSRSLKLRFQEHIRYIWHNNPQSAYAQHSLQNRHESGPIEHLMTVLKHLRDTTLLTPYEQYFIHSLYQKGTKPGRNDPSSPACHRPQPTYHLQKPVTQPPSYSTRSAKQHARKPCLPHQQVRIIQYPLITTLANYPLTQNTNSRNTT
jgi:hypothetical protein